MSVSVDERTGTDVTSEDEDELSGWFCIKTNPFPCPNPECGMIVNYCTAMHKIIIWPRKDDPDMLDVAQDCLEVGRNPHIIEYEQAMGEAITYDALMHSGRGRVHGFHVE